MLRLSRMESGRNPARKLDSRSGSTIAQHRVDQCIGPVPGGAVTGLWKNEPDPDPRNPNRPETVAADPPRNRREPVAAGPPGPSRSAGSGGRELRKTSAETRPQRGRGRYVPYD